MKIKNLITKLIFMCNLQEVLFGGVVTKEVSKTANSPVQSNTEGQILFKPIPVHHSTLYFIGSTN